MLNPLAGLRFPSERALLSRTKLAYVNLPRLLTDAKRDRSARVSGYVAIWLPDSLIMLYMRGGELINASRDDGHARQSLAISDALARIPLDPEWGDVCFHAAPDAQLDCMYTTFSMQPELASGNGAGASLADVFERSRDTSFSGLMELVVDSHVNYLVFDSGKVARAFVSGEAEQPLAERVDRALRDGPVAAAVVRCYPTALALPEQAPPQLTRAYRELIDSLVASLRDGGRDSAAAIAEHARTVLSERHPALRGFSPKESEQFDPIVTSDELTRAVAAWVTDTMWAGCDLSAVAPEDILKAVTRERRHMFQSAGFFDHVPWKLEW